MINQERFSAWEFGSTIVVSHWSSLKLQSLGDFEEPLVLGEGLANAFHLQSVCFPQDHNQNLCDILVRDGDCIVRHL
jgi:hypothetical protein